MLCVLLFICALLLAGRANADSELDLTTLGLEDLMEIEVSLAVRATLRFVDRLPTYAIDRYAELDLRLGWRPESHLEFSVAAQDLLHDSHAEFSDIYVNTVPTWTQRGFYGTIAWTF